MAKRRRIDAPPEPVAKKSPKPRKYPASALRAIRRELCKLRSSLLGVVDGALRDRWEANPWARDPVDAAQGICADDVSRSVLGMSRETLAAITAAIERIDDGTYGVCRRCAGQIARTRLEALPIVACCTECQHTVEQEKSRTRRAKPHGDATAADDGEDGEEEDEDKDEEELEEEDSVEEDHDGEDDEEDDLSAL